MKYFLDTEFLEGTQKKLFGETKPIIDLISIGIVCEDGREYYAISKDFNLKEAWNRFDWKQKKVSDGIPGAYKDYWIRENVLKPIWEELIEKERQYYMEMFKRINVWTKYIDNDYYKFTYKEFKRLIKKYGKTNKQIAEEIVQFVDARWIEEGNISKGFMYPGGTSIEEVKTTNVQFYGYYSDYDWVVFCWLFGKMIDLPKGFPKYCIDLKQELDRRFPNGKYGTTVVIPKLVNGTLLAELSPKTEYKEINIKEHPNYPKQNNEHNALSDAKWNFELFQFLQGVS